MNPLFLTELIDLDAATVGELIRAYRTADRNDGAPTLTQAELAEQVGISQAHLSQIESGLKRIASEADLAAFCDKLKLPEPETERLRARWKSESTSSLDRRLAKLRRSSDEVVPGVPLEALRILLETNPTARAAVVAWLAELPTRRHRVVRSDAAPRNRRPSVVARKKGRGVQ